VIITDLEHIAGHINITPAMQKAIDYLRHHHGRELPPGKVEIDGNRVLANVRIYDTIVTDAGSSPA